jgi:hypothetical protein
VVPAIYTLVAKAHVPAEVAEPAVAKFAGAVTEPTPA